MTPACYCGGETYVDLFDWPKKQRQWFLRCGVCREMSKSVATYEETLGLSIEQRSEVK